MTLDDIMKDIETEQDNESIISPAFGNTPDYIDKELEQEINKIEANWSKRGTQKI